MTWEEKKRADERFKARILARGGWSRLPDWRPTSGNYSFGWSGTRATVPWILVPDDWDDCENFWENEERQSVSALESRMARLNFGKYAGSEIEDVPEDYLRWLRKQAEDRIAEVDQELGRREAVETASLPMVEKLVQEGYRALAKRMHPDAGGSTQEFQALQGAWEQLKVVLKEVRNVSGVS